MAGTIELKKSKPEYRKGLEEFMLNFPVNLLDNAATMTLVAFEHIPIIECNEPLIDLEDKGFVLEPAYFQLKLSSTPKLYTRQQVLTKLLQVQRVVLPYRLKIWDPWRSRVVQGNIYRSFWNQLSAENPHWDEVRLKKEVGTFCTAPDNPSRIPPHSTGGAIDLTLVDKNDFELNMGTGFDHLGPESASLFFEEIGRDQKIRDNRRILREAMLAADFRMDDDEWWHFDFGNQLWAAAKGKPYAIYGEITKPPHEASIRGETDYLKAKARC